VNDSVSVENSGAEALKRLQRGRLARADRTGQADEKRRRSAVGRRR
jgi:hypothetical protein